MTRTEQFTSKRTEKCIIMANGTSKFLEDFLQQPVMIYIFLYDDAKEN